YGIGVERIIACSIEQSHDEFGIIWNKSIAPFMVHLISVNTNNAEVVKVAEDIYEMLNQNAIDVIYDDRTNVSPGFKFKDADLLGMPLQIIVGEKNIANQKIEVKKRKTNQRQLIDISEVVSFVKKFINEPD
ncbi:MAG: His/Gly/Thr/Pro-type tRNA ligase C-terminal domain-containing protein, partial [Bacteroidetes bacterium]|nr:His/Gly/Thr/Pro-type tRNA ligase C-terminal domain-containing protein [Bacteroidota bacterium]